MIANSGVGIYEDPVLSWKRFDALPAELRRVYDYAPFPVHLGKARRRLEVYEKRAGATVPEMRKAEIFLLCQAIQEQALKTYGPDHPDAARSRLKHLHHVPAGRSA